jgi:phage regulator Rha-like protein
MGSTGGTGKYFNRNVVNSGFKLLLMEIISAIQNRIYVIRGERVMLDFDLAALYEVETKALNQAVKRNIERFPEDFIFQLTPLEWSGIRSQSVTAYQDLSLQNRMVPSLRSQFVTLETAKGKHTKYLPYAFTEQGIAMLSGVLRSERAVQMNIAIMRAFVAIRKIVLLQHEAKEQLKQIKEKIEEHDIQLGQIYDAIENLLDDKAAQRKWEERERIGFKK